MALKVMGSNPIIHPIYAGMAELADALDLGSSVIDVGVQVLFPAPLLLWVVVKKVEFLGSTFFVAKQQGSRVPNRCEASWKGGVLIYLTIILYKPFVGHTIKCKCTVDTFCGFFHNNGALDLHSNFIQLFFSPLQDSLLFVNK